MEQRRGVVVVLVVLVVLIVVAYLLDEVNIISVSNIIISKVSRQLYKKRPERERKRETVVSLSLDVDEPGRRRRI